MVKRKRRTKLVRECRRWLLGAEVVVWRPCSFCCDTQVQGMRGENTETIERLRNTVKTEKTCNFVSLILRSLYRYTLFKTLVFFLSFLYLSFVIHSSLFWTDDHGYVFKILVSYMIFFFKLSFIFCYPPSSPGIFLFLSLKLQICLRFLAFSMGPFKLLNLFLVS